MIIRFILLLFMLSMACNAYLNNTVIEKGITLLQPGLNIAYIKKLSAIIDKYSRKFDVDWEIIVAILKVESNFNVKAVNYKSNDFGIGQINIINMKHYGFDLGKQLTDVDYAVHNTCLILYDLKQKYNTKSQGVFQWFTRYHSYTSNYRKIYYEKLKKYLIILKKGRVDGQRNDKKDNG